MISMSDKPIFQASIPSLIIEAETGILLNSQVGGMSCRQAEIEGFMLNLPHEFYMIDNGCEHGGCWDCPLEENFLKDVNIRIERILSRYLSNPLGFKFEIDFDRISESTEGLFPIKITDFAGPSYLEQSNKKFLIGRKAWMILENCD